MKPRVYLDTSIPSAYYDQRSQFKWRKDITREWWQYHRRHYQLYISYSVLYELEHGAYPHKREILDLVEDLSILDTVQQIDDIVSIYGRNKLTPKGDHGDSWHLAIASYYKLDYLLTWNCKNLANANKMGHIESISKKHRLWIPRLITPEQLFWLPRK